MTQVFTTPCFHTRPTKVVHKRSFILTELLILSAVLLQFFWSASITHTKPQAEAQSKAQIVCPFCKESVIAYQQYHESERWRVLYNYKPMLPGHSMLIPKRHVQRLEELNTDEIVEFHTLTKRIQRAFKDVYGTEEYLLCLQNGPSAGQTVAHVHFHMIPREEKNVWTKIKLWIAMLWRPIGLLNPLDHDEMEAQKGPLRDALALSLG